MRLGRGTIIVWFSFRRFSFLTCIDSRITLPDSLALFVPVAADGVLCLTSLLLSDAVGLQFRISDEAADPLYQGSLELVHDAHHASDIYSE